MAPGFIPWLIREFTSALFRPREDDPHQLADGDCWPVWARPSATGSHPSDQARSGLGASRFDPARKGEG